ncbi:hypothetical protein [Reinekea sp. G2M2-21]|uniref:hypothetical protein n=1 Tax=Reinekea sp. G2M2-21 TaxID=2788942 RepID=UPI0018AB104A|nr:hypothetical protein [Reinekea sp. G2M2-21]
MRTQRGIALIAAIFLVVVIGAALILLATLSLRGSQQTTQNLLQMRANAAALAAIDYGVQLLISGSNCTAPSLQGSITVPAYADYTINLSCTQNSYNRTSQAVNIFELSVDVEYGTVDTPDYVWVNQKTTVEL